MAHNTMDCYCCEPTWVPTQSMNLDNDPRFFMDTVIDRRISAFAALSIVSGLMAGASVDQCFDSSKDFRLVDHSKWYKIDIFGWLQLSGFSLMCIVLALNVCCTLVFASQFFFTIRLLTAGPTGFESAKSFYMDPKMVYWRHFSAQTLIKGMPMFLLSVGLMLCVKAKREEVSDSYHAISWLTCLFFCVSGLWLYCVAIQHRELFEDKYSQGHDNMRPYLALVEQEDPSDWW